MAALVRYSLSLSDLRERTSHLTWQLLTSVQSLRAHNPRIQIVVNCYGVLPEAIRSQLLELDVAIVGHVDYATRLKKFGPGKWRALSHYPVLHKFLDLSSLKRFSPTQVLLLDCDTLINKNLTRFLASHTSADCYGRADTGSIRGASHSDSVYLDEAGLQNLAESIGARFVPPFNTGVVLLNRGLWLKIARMERLYVELAWRQMLWLAEHPARDEGDAVRYIRKMRMARSIYARSLRYPSSNGWIVEQVAAWLTLGKVGRITTADFNAREVPYFHDLKALACVRSRWAICHYFSRNTKEVQRLISRSDWQVSDIASSPKAHSRVRRPFLQQGYVILTGLPNRRMIDALRREALARFRGAQREDVWYRDPGQIGSDSVSDRETSPRRAMYACPGGPALSEFYNEPGLLRFLFRQCGMRVRRSGSNGTYNFYLSPGDFIGLHRDHRGCDVTLISALTQPSTTEQGDGDLVLYPGRSHESLAEIRRSPTRGAKLIRLSVGQSLLLSGGVVAHRVDPVKSQRIVSALCFSAY